MRRDTPLAPDPRRHGRRWECGSWAGAPPCPTRVVTNADLERTLDTSDEWIVERSGIRERRIGESAAELAIAAGRSALAATRPSSPASIDLMILATTTPDQTVPATSAARPPRARPRRRSIRPERRLLRLRLRTRHGERACSSSRRPGACWSSAPRRLSRITDWNDRNTAVLFGDGGGALVLEAVRRRGPAPRPGISGSTPRPERSCTATTTDFIKMDGREVFKRAVRVMVDSSRRTLEQREGPRGGRDARRAAPGEHPDHPGRLRSTRASSVNAPPLVLERTGQHVQRLDSARPRRTRSTPADVADGDLVLLAGFGAGMTWGSALIRWQGTPLEAGAATT